MASIYIKLADIAKSTCVILAGSYMHRIPVVKFAENSFVFFMIDSDDQQAINMNQKMYDFFTSKGIWPELDGGYFIVNQLSELLQVVGSDDNWELRFESSTAHDF